VLDILWQGEIRNKLINFSKVPEDVSQAMENAPPEPALPGLRWAFTLEIAFDLGLFHETVAGEKGFLRSGGGRVFGPRLQGTVEEQAGDWPVLRPDGIVESDARYMIRSADGEHIYMRSRGYLRAGDVDAFRAGSSGSQLYYRCSPQFDPSVGPHQWLSRSVFVGSGTFDRQGARIDVFEVL
jgi:hypothetical protein